MPLRPIIGDSIYFIYILNLTWKDFFFFTSVKGFMFWSLFICLSVSLTVFRIYSKINEHLTMIFSCQEGRA